MGHLGNASPAPAERETRKDGHARRHRFGSRQGFRTKGYHAATVRDIADEVGILKGSLYHHFDSKEDLLYLVVKEPIAQMYARSARSPPLTRQPPKSSGGRYRRISKPSTATIPHLFVYLRERSR